MFRSGAFVVDHVSPIEENQLQPNGVDLTLDVVFEQLEPGRIGRDGKEIGDRVARPLEELEQKDPDTYYLPKGVYRPLQRTDRDSGGHVGFVYPRSSLMRNSCMLNTAVWDAGYEGRGEGLLQVHHDIQIERGARIAQLVFAEANHEDVYDGVTRARTSSRRFSLLNGRSRSRLQPVRDEDPRANLGGDGPPDRSRRVRPFCIPATRSRYDR